VQAYADPSAMSTGFGRYRAFAADVEAALIEGAGHFPQEAATAPTWAAISDFARGRQP
jgi:pimeloyl-ACP methyl ester carboxylesterase